MSAAKFTCKRASSLNLIRNEDSETVRVFVGKEAREFAFPKQLLDSTSMLFSDMMADDQYAVASDTLYLKELCPDMFELFTYWVYNHSNFQPFIDAAEADDRCEDLQWDLINLHLFAAQINLDILQDVAMDAIQDLYLRRNWDINPTLVNYVYSQCDAEDSCRLRKWIVAMAAYCLGGCVEIAGTVDKMEKLFHNCPELWSDYMAHLTKTSRSRVPLYFKNPQLRLPSNNLRNEERQFGFRQCTFHTHRSSVGQGKCPHSIAQSVAPGSPVSDEDSDFEFTSFLKEEIVMSPRTAIFDLYLDI
ncbi:hypothetical protein BX600DRAFT_170458 [Xylariales sp. PMI_506]|nr:hypothetical protein BX600DRAFT_170458 [Xylariales sp. PMI_506]